MRPPRFRLRVMMAIVALPALGLGIEANRRWWLDRRAVCLGRASYCVKVERLLRDFAKNQRESAARARAEASQRAEWLAAMHIHEAEVCEFNARRDEEKADSWHQQKLAFDRAARYPWAPVPEFKESSLYESYYRPRLGLQKAPQPARAPTPPAPGR